MSKPNLSYPCLTLQLDNYKPINEQMYKYIKINQSKDIKGISKVILKVGIQRL